MVDYIFIDILITAIIISIIVIKKLIVASFRTVITESVFDGFDVIGDIGIAEAVVVCWRVTPKVIPIFCKRAVLLPPLLVIDDLPNIVPNTALNIAVNIACRSYAQN